MIEEPSLPANLDSERFILGSILVDHSYFIQVAGTLQADDFSLEKHKLIFARMAEINERGERIDRITLAHELMQRRQLESVDGLGYLVSLDDGLPQTFNVDSYTRLVKDKSVLRQIVYASQHTINRAMANQETPSEILSELSETALRLGASQVKSGLESTEQIINNFPGGLNALLDPSKRPQGTKTGFNKFDEMTGGLHAGELILLAARPSMGKTALAMNIAMFVAQRRQGAVAFFSLEMSKQPLMDRLLCSTARVDAQKFRLGYLSSDERVRLQKAATQIAQAPLHIDHSPGITIHDLHAKLRRAESEQGGPFALAIVDYIQLMGSRGRYENRNLEVGSISRGMKLLAKEMRMPLMALSQLSRATETRAAGNHRPQLSDLRESGSLEQDADLVAFIFREEVYNREREDLKGLAELIIGKQRNGPVGKVDLVFLNHLTRFENRTEDLPDDPKPLWNEAGV